MSQVTGFTAKISMGNGMQVWGSVGPGAVCFVCGVSSVMMVMLDFSRSLC